jgi:hypothetical protein
MWQYYPIGTNSVVCVTLGFSDLMDNMNYQRHNGYSTNKNIGTISGNVSNVGCNSVTSYGALSNIGCTNCCTVPMLRV